MGFSIRIYLVYMDFIQRSCMQQKRRRGRASIDHLLRFTIRWAEFGFSHVPRAVWRQPHRSHEKLCVRGSLVLELTAFQLQPSRHAAQSTFHLAQVLKTGLHYITVNLLWLSPECYSTLFHIFQRRGYYRPTPCYNRTPTTRSSEEVTIIIASWSCVSWWHQRYAIPHQL